MDMSSFDPHPADGINPACVPVRTLFTGAVMPAIGLGTFGNDRFTPEQIAASVLGAISVGYRFIDCAAVYGNEAEIGRVLDHVLRHGIRRDELFISSKLWNDKHSPKDVRPTLEQSLRDLRVDYLDMYFIHWPFPNTHPPGASHDSRSPDARPYNHDAFMATYRELERAADAGLIRHIGTSNMTVPKLRKVLPDVLIKPAANQMEMHPCFSQPEFFDYLTENGIVPIAYCPVGSPGRPARDTDPTDVSELENPIIRGIAEAHGVHPAVICVKWAAQRGQVPIPSSIHREKYLGNLRSITEDPLSADEMAAIQTVEANCRLIKGQVFLWEGASSWRDLWDMDGVIVE